jgi:CRP-like cAMP-binding protein
MTSLQGAARFTTGTPLPVPFEITATRELGRGDTLYRVGDAASSAYRVEVGLLKLSIGIPTGRERIVGVAGPGDVIGAVIPLHGVHHDEAQALSPQVQVSVLNLGPSPHLQEYLFAAAAQQLQHLREALEDSELPVPVRLARTLVRLAERFGQAEGDGTVRLNLPLTHDNLAALVGAARETTSTILSEMRSSGVLHGTRGDYTFDLTVLADYAAAALAGN